MKSLFLLLIICFVIPSYENYEEPIQAINGRDEISSEFNFQRFLESTLINRFDLFEREFNLTNGCLEMWRLLHNDFLAHKLTPEYEKEYYWSRKSWISKP